METLEVPQAELEKIVSIASRCKKAENRNNLCSKCDGYNRKNANFCGHCGATFLTVEQIEKKELNSPPLRDKAAQK